MKTSRHWRAMAAVVAATGLLLLPAAAATAQLEPITDPLQDAIGGDDAPDADADAPDTPDELGAGGFVGCASATGLSVSVSLPEELAPAVEPLRDGLAPDREPFGAFCAEPDLETGGATVTVDLSRAQAELFRAGQGDEPSSFVEALATNLVAGNAPCEGLPAVDIPPDADTPILSLRVANVDCDEEDPFQALASAEVAGLYLNVGALITTIGAEALADGLEQILEPVNDQVIQGLQDGALDPLCEGLSDNVPGIGAIFDECLGLTGEGLRILNPLDIQVPLVDLATLETDTSVVFEDGVVTSTARSTIANLEVLGVVCVEGSDAGQEFAYTATATSDGQQATAQATSTNVTARICGEPRILEVLPVEGLLASVGIGETTLAEALEGVNLGPVRDGLEELLLNLGVFVAEPRPADIEEVDGPAARAYAQPFSVAVVSPFSQIDGLNESPLGQVAVRVAGLGTFAAVNAGPDDVPVAAGPAPTPAGGEPAQLPRTGTGVAALLGLGALGAAAALRRRNA